MSAAPVLQFPRPEPVPTGSFEAITEHLIALFDSLDLCETDAARAECQNEIARYIEAEIRKVDGIAGYLKHCKRQKQFAAAEIKRLRALKTAWDNRFEVMKSYAVRVFQFHSIKKLQGRTSSLTLQPCPPSVDISNDEAVPLTYKTVTLVISGETWDWLQMVLPTVKPKLIVTSKTAVREALEQKIEIPGATLRTDKQTVVCR